MAQERVRGEDSEPQVSRNAADMAGTYEVTAKDGIHVDADEYSKGDKVELNAAAARALFNEGSIKETN